MLSKADQLRVGIVGYGKMGRVRHRVVDTLASLKLVAVYDPRATGNSENGLRFTSNLSELLSLELDALIVCVPNNEAARCVIAGLESGLHVFCEKPPGRNMDEIAAVLRVAKSRPHQKLMYGFNHRRHGSVQKALEIKNSGVLGNLLSLRGIYGKPGWDVEDWRTERRLSGGGILLDQGIHMVDLLRLFAGEFSQVQSHIFATAKDAEVEDNAFALMRTDAGIVAMLHSSATETRPRFHLELNLEQGTLRLDGILSESGKYAPESLVVSGAVNEEFVFTVDNSFTAELCSFRDAVHNDSELVWGGAEDAYKSMKLVYQIYCADPSWRNRYGLSADPLEGRP